MKIVIVIPTYNEAENIKKLIPVLAEEFKLIPNHTIEVLVVDGNSPDNTKDIVAELSKTYTFVKLLLEKQKNGLGAAYVYGFRYAMNTLAADVLVEMDADFQHDPKDVKRLIQKIDEGYDYVIGSRFTRGGSIPQEWEFYRKFLSIGGNIFSKFVLGIFNVNDFTSGFKASRVKGFVDSIDLDNILSKGFAYKIDLLFKMHKAKAKITEIPIAFGVRDRGLSKMENNNMLDSMRVVIMLRLKSNKNFFKFLVTGSLGFLVDTLLFNALRLFNVSLFYFSVSKSSSLISGFFALLTTYLLNNFWSFRDRKHTKKRKMALNYVGYSFSSYIPIIFRSYLINHAVTAFGDTFIVSNIAFLIGIMIGLVWNFTVYSKIIWKKKK